MMLRTPVCSYPIILTHLSFNFLCLLLLYSIYLNDCHTRWRERGCESLSSEEGTYTLVLFIYTYFVIMTICSGIQYLKPEFKNVATRAWHEPYTIIVHLSAIVYYILWSLSPRTHLPPLSRLTICIACIRLY